MAALGAALRAAAVAAPGPPQQPVRLPGARRRAPLGGPFFASPRPPGVAATAAGGEGGSGEELRRSSLPQPGDVLVGDGAAPRQYRVLRSLGAGGFGTAYEAEVVVWAPGEEQGAADPPRVAIKALSLRGQRNDSGGMRWKAVQLIEREAATLRALSHPGIPRFLEFFVREKPEDVVYLLVQELVVGRTLADVVRAGWRPTEAQLIQQLAEPLLEVLEYLGDLRPPVVHRDIKVMYWAVWATAVYALVLLPTPPRPPRTLGLACDRSRREPAAAGACISEI